MQITLLVLPLPSPHWFIEAGTHVGDGKTNETNLPIFKLKDSTVRRRYSDFEWLKNELERDSKIVVPPLPGKALKRQLPFRGDEGIFEDAFIEERRVGLEQFINRSPSGPKRALSSHVFAGREHRPQLRSRKVMERPSDHGTQLFGLQIQ
ncbi:sorting nexin-12-like isoform X6 [Oncorhynchus keta]|uniref:sorting nexin-12-like isoform X6 n=1 Tax=Oncorhynchus keta TaxID=8018 RepID=UPI00227BCD7E|nr:sorting nexin-12-like isoform X6 [Oncorhynchus keta]